MLEGLCVSRKEFIVIRFAVQFRFSEKMDQLGLDSVDSDEFRALLHRHSELLDAPESLCDIPFGTPRAGRYSDGTFGVLYASLDEETALSEIIHGFRQWLYEKHGICNGYYVQFQVHFSGRVKDITVMRDHWPSLTADDHDEFCKSIATEAREIRLDAIIVPSARTGDRLGKNVVVFSRDSLGTPTDYRNVKLTYDPNTDTVEDTWISRHTGLSARSASRGRT